MTRQSQSQPSLVFRWIVRVGSVVLSALSLWAMGWGLAYTWELSHAPPERLRLGFAALGISAGTYFWFHAVILGAMFLTYFLVATLLFRRLAHDRMGVFVATFLMAFGGANAYPAAPEILDRITTGPAYVTVPYMFLNLLSWPFVLPFFAMYPDGVFLPRWMRYLAAYFVLFAAGWGVFPQLFARPSGWMTLWVFGSVFLVFSSIIYSQVYRYRRHSTPVQRQQTKWMVYGVAVFAIANFLSNLLTGPGIVGSSSDPAGGLRAELVATAIFGLSSMAVPLAVGIGILRYRLYDIDLIINRTLVYGPLTAIVAGLIAASARLSQNLFVILTGQESDLALVLSTFLVVTASTPIRTRLQAFVDRYFKESSDAARDVRAFRDKVQDTASLISPQGIARRYMAEVAMAFETEGAALFLGRGKTGKVVETVGNWKGEAAMEVPLGKEKGSLGRLLLGRRKGGRPFNRDEREALQEAAEAVAEAMSAPAGWGRSDGGSRQGTAKTRRRKT